MAKKVNGGKKTVKKILNAALTAFCVCVFALIAVTAYSKITGKTVVPYSVLWVLTDSMEDAIPARSYILVKKVNPKDVKVGDVITFRSREAAISGSLNTHRVVEIIGDNEEFVTKGDNSSFGVDSAHVLPEDIQAVYVRNLPVLTFLGRVFTSAAGFALCIAFMLAGTVFWFVRYFVQKRKATDKEEFDRLVKEEVKRLEEQAQAKRDSGVKDLTTGETDTVRLNPTTTAKTGEREDSDGNRSDGNER